MAPQRTPVFSATSGGLYRPSAQIYGTVVRNKADITGETLGISEVNGHSRFRLSARTGEGVDVLRNHLRQSMGF